MRRRDAQTTLDTTILDAPREAVHTPTRVHERHRGGELGHRDHPY